MFYRCEFFKIQELVDKATFEEFGEDAWMFLRTEALVSLDGIRRFFGTAVTVNDWLWGGKFELRGFRPRFVNTGATYSQHRFGNAFDLDVKGISAEIVRETILKNKDHHSLVNITCLEKDIPWVHFDCRNIIDRIRLVLP